MERIMKKPELVDELSARTGFYKKDMMVVVSALEKIVAEHFETATFDDPSELHITPGVVICGRRTPEHESIDPRDRSAVTTPEKVVPFAVFKPSIRKKLYVQKKKRGRKAKTDE